MSGDLTVYPVGTAPSDEVRRIFCRCGLPEGLRLGLALHGFVNTDMIANLADTLADFKDSVKTLFTEETLGKGAALTVSMTQLAGVWRKCRGNVQHADAQRLRLEVDPTAIPEMAVAEYAEMRENFVKRHPDVLLTDYREPHKRFLERVSRDRVIHDVIPIYQLGEIRLRSEVIIQKSGLAPTAEHLLRIAKLDEAASVGSEEDALARLHAFFVTLEYLGVCGYSRFHLSDTGEWKGDALDYLLELENRRRDTPGLPYIVNVDRKIRKKVHQLNSEQHQDYPTFSVALRAVLTGYRHFRSEARTQCTRSKSLSRKRSRSPATRRNESKRMRALQDEVKTLRDELEGARVGGAQIDPRELPLPPGKDSKDSKDSKPRPKRVPDSEWTAMQHTTNSLPKDAVSTRCKFCNLSSGCSNAKCTRRHVCIVCGEAHHWTDKHFSSK